MKPERRFLPVTAAPLVLESRADKEPVIVGYGAVFFNAADPGTEYRLWEDFVEHIMPGAFDRALREDDVRALFNHDPNHLLGRNVAKTLRLSVDAKGLRYEVDPPKTASAEAVLEGLRRKDLTGSSFSFEVIEDEVRSVTLESKQTWIREIRQVRLWDVGPVTFPAYSASEADVRSLRARVAEAPPPAALRAPDYIAARARVIGLGL